jgi:hypothetical protein
LLQPAVTTICPSWMGSLLSMKSRSITLGSPASGSATPCGPFGWTTADTALSESVMSVTFAVKGVTSVTRPTSPSPFTTGSFTATPSFEPASTWTVEYQTVGGRWITRDVTMS